MEMNHEYASKGVAGAGLGTGIAGLSLGVLNAMGGLASLGGLFGGNGWNRFTAAQNDVLTAALTASIVNSRSGVPCVSDCDPFTQREMRLVQEIAAKDSQIALRDANTYGDQKILELYKYIDGKHIEFEKQFAAQAVQNQATKDSFQLLQERQDCCCQRLETAIQQTPVGQIHAASWPNGAPGHSWQNVSIGRTDIGRKAALHAGKVLAAAAIDLFEDPALLEAAKAEFEKRTAEGYTCPIPADAVPTVAD